MGRLTPGALVCRAVMVRKVRELAQLEHVVARVLDHALRAVLDEVVQQRERLPSQALRSAPVYLLNNSSPEPRNDLEDRAPLARVRVGRLPDLARDHLVRLAAGGGVSPLSHSRTRASERPH